MFRDTNICDAELSIRIVNSRSGDSQAENDLEEQHQPLQALQLAGHIYSPLRVRDLDTLVEREEKMDSDVREQMLLGTQNKQLCTEVKKNFVGRQESFLSIIKRRKMAWIGYFTRHKSLYEAIKSGTVEGGRKRGCQRDKLVRQHEKVDGHENVGTLQI